MTEKKVDYPEHKKLLDLQPQTQVVAEFIDFIVDEYEPYCFENPAKISEIMAKFFEVDIEKIEEEKSAMVDELRRKNIEVTEVDG